MQTTFIDDVVNDLDKNQQDFSNTIFVLPSRRAGVFLRNTLSRKLSQPIFSPEVYSIEEFIEHISGLKSAHNTTQLFTFYSIYKELFPEEEKEPFSTFIGWAQTVLHDFNEIDRHQVPQDAFFQYIHATKKIEEWTIEDKETPLVSSYLRFWEKLPDYYDAFCDRLLSQGRVHQGLVYRKAAEEVEIYIQNKPSQNHVFLGFNALNASEQEIIQALLAAGNSMIYWDTDAAFVESKTHEAGLFLRAHRRSWSYFKNSTFNWVSRHYTAPKKIKVAATAQPVEQIKYVGSILKEMDEHQVNHTAVVLGDESLLIPLLNSLPENVKNVNVTMGLSLALTPPASFFELLFKIARSNNSQGFYYKDVIEVLSHPQGTLLFENLATQVTSFASQTNSVYLSKDDLSELSEEKRQLVELLFRDWEGSPQVVIDNCLTILEQLKVICERNNQIILLEYIFGFYNLFNKLDHLNKEYGYIKDVATLQQFYRDAIVSESIDLKGDPYKGLQIMGVLESRVLDFENVILTSVNEGILPAGKSTNSYIPYELKKEYNLPTYREKDAVYSYHFYRLLQRASNINILYTTANDGVGSAEKSRFIQQLEIDSTHSIEHIQVGSKINHVAYVPFSIPKSPEIIAKLKSLAQSGFSPSSLSTYLKNPISFYYKYILGVKEQDEVEETVAANTMGTILHNTLESLYLPYKGIVLEQMHFDKMLVKTTETVDHFFAKAYSNTSKATGKNRIIYEVICEYVRNFIKQEAQGGQIQPLELEQKIKVPFSFTKEIPVFLNGTVDRVDIRNNQMTIIDYKSGSVESKDLSISQWEDLLAPEGKYEKAFQILMYAYMLHKVSPIHLPASAGIISLKKLKNGFMPFKMNKAPEITNEVLLAFENQLQNVLLEIFNPDVPFEDSGFTYKK